MRFRCRNKTLCTYGKEYDVEILVKYVNGWKVRLKDNGDTGWVQKCDAEVLEMSEEEKNMQIGF